MGLSVVIALATVWIAIAVSYHTNWPVGFFVGTIAAVCYAAGRACTALRRTRVAQRTRLSAGAGIDVSHAA
jgi:zinc/manganese transport system permease protein